MKPKDFVEEDTAELQELMDKINPLLDGCQNATVVVAGLDIVCRRLATMSDPQIAENIIQNLPGAIAVIMNELRSEN